MASEETPTRRRSQTGSKRCVGLTFVCTNAVMNERARERERDGKERKGEEPNGPSFFFFFFKLRFHM